MCKVTLIRPHGDGTSDLGLLMNVDESVLHRLDVSSDVGNKESHIAHFGVIAA